MTGVEADDRRLISEVAGGPIDFVLDFLPREATGSQVRAAALAVRPRGRVVLMGGVRAAWRRRSALPYIWIMQQQHHRARPVYVPARGYRPDGAR